MSEACDILSFKTSHFYFHHEKMSDIAHYKKIHYTELQEKLPSLKMPSMNSCHESNISNLISLIWTFVLSSNQYVAAQSVE
jgi:hypothetical protein